MDSMKASLTGIPLQLDVISLEQNRLTTDVLLLDEDTSFFFSVLWKCNMYFIYGEGGEEPSQARCCWWEVDIIFHRCKGLFPCCVEDGEFFGVVRLLSLLHSSRHSPLKGTFGNHMRLWGKGRQISPLFLPTQAVAHDRFMPAALPGFICLLNFISPLWVFILLRDCQGSC